MQTSAKPIGVAGNVEMFIVPYRGSRRSEWSG